MKKNRMSKRVISAVLAFTLIVTACFQYGFGTKAADYTNAEITAFSTMLNGQQGFIQFQMDAGDWGVAANLTVPGEQWLQCDFTSKIRIYRGDSDSIGVMLSDTLAGEVYYNFFGTGKTLALSIKNDIYNEMSKVYIPAGTVFPSYQNSSKGHFVTTKDIWYVGQPCQNPSTWVAWDIEKTTAVDTVTIDTYDNRIAFGIAGDEDNDSITTTGEVVFIAPVVCNKYNFSEFIEIYYKNNTESVKLSEVWTPGENLYWNLYPNTMALPLISTDVASIEKIVVKKGCEFPSYAYTGGNALMDGFPVREATDPNARIAYVLKEDAVFLPKGDSTSGKIEFEYQDQSETITTEVIGVVTDHNQTIKFRLSNADYAGYGLVRPSTKHNDYNYLEQISLHTPDGVYSLKQAFENSTNKEIYYNLSAENEFAIDIGSLKETITKVTIPAGTVYPSIIYTGYGAWNATEISDNMIRSKGGFETSEDVTYVKGDDGTWSVEETGPITTDVTKIILRNADNADSTDYRLHFFLSENDYPTDTSYEGTEKVAEYNFLEKTLLIDADGEEHKLQDVVTNSTGFYKCWGEPNAIGFQLEPDLPLIVQVKIPADTEFPMYSYTNGTADRNAYVVENETIFTVEGTPENNKWNTNWTREEVLPLEEVPTKVNNIHVREGSGWKLLLFTDVNDYSDAQPNTSAADLIKLEKYNTLDYIDIETTTGKTYTLREIYDNNVTYQIWDETENRIAYHLKNIDPVCKVTIKQGCQLPSYAFTNGTPESQIAYVVENDTIFTYSGEGQPDSYRTIWTREEILPLKEVETTVRNLHIRHDPNTGYHMLFFLNNNDYESGQVCHKLGAYELLDKVTLYTTSGKSFKLSEVSENDSSFIKWSEADSFSVKLKDGLDVIKKVVIESGAQFPSQAFENGTADAQIAYTTTSDIALVPNGSVPADNKGTVSWIEEPILPTETISTDISNIHIRVGKLLLMPTVHDYGNVPKTTIMNSLVHYNTADKIVLYKGNESAKLSEVIIWNGTDAPCYNIWEGKGNLAISLKSGWDGTNIDKVVIQAGCQIPSYQYTNGTNPTKDVYYTVPKELTFTTTNLTEENLSWDKELVKEEAPTDITNIHIRTGTVGDDENVTELLLFLSLNDYGTDSNQLVDSTKLLKYQYADKIRLTATDGTVMLLKDVLQEKSHYNVWGEKGSIAFRFKTDKIISKVEVLEGCELPSKGYTTGTANSQLTYVVPETITFMSNDTSQGNNWSISWTKTASVEAVKEATRITNVHVRTGDNLRLLLFLSENDYQTSEVQVNVNRLAMYNILENIILYTTDGVAHTLRDVYDNVATYNIWNEKGSIALQLKNTIGTIEKVYIRNGCELPSREYTEADAPSERKTYVVEEDTLFTVSTTPADNSHTVHWNRINPRTTNTTVKSISFENGLLSFILGVSDYGNAELEMGAKHSDYNYLSTIRVYTSDTEYLTLGDAMKTGKAYFSENNTVKVTIDGSTPIRIVVPAWTVFPAKAYVNGTNAEMAGYEISDEKIFEFIDGTWKDVSINITRVYGDANGDKKLSSLDLVRMKKYFRDGYGMNRFGNCDDDATVNENDIVLLRKSMVGSYTLHPYVKESADLTYFMSQDRNMDYFLNDYFKRHAGYVDYVEGEMTATSYRPGEAFEGMFNTQWVMEASTWYSSDGFNYDAAESLKEWLEMVPVDRYGYVWNGNDLPEDTNIKVQDAKHAMGWPLPNASQANSDGGGRSVYWDFNGNSTEENACVWDSNINATVANGVYSGTANNTQNPVQFYVWDKAVFSWLRDSIVQTEYAPWLAIDLRISGDVENIDDIYIYYTDSKSGTKPSTYKISAKETAPIWYNMEGDTYEHMLYVPMYTQDTWHSGDGTAETVTSGAKDIYGIMIEIVPKEGKTLNGTFALNYVRPSFDTRYSNNNALYISTLKEYYSMTGDISVVEENITNARKAMNFLMQMYDEGRKLNNQSYLFGHYGDQEKLAGGMVNGYWDVTYTPVYDFQSNMYFYEALNDLVYLENALEVEGVTVDSYDKATIMTATIDELGSSDYTYASSLETTASDVLAAMQATTANGGFWNGTRFVAGKDNSGNVVDNGHVVWNLQAVESGIATDQQAASIMNWIDGEADMYQFGLAPMANTIDNVTSKMYSSFYPHTEMSKNGIGDFENNVQNGGAVMFSSYYDLISRLRVNGTEDAYNRLQAIQKWYKPISEAYDYQTEEAKEFYYNYFKEQGKADYYLQNGNRGFGNGIIGLDGEFPESLLTVAAVPRGFFGVDSISASCLGISPSLPEDLQHWKIENMEFNNVKYDVSIFHGVTRIDGVDGDTQGLTVQIAMDYKEGQSVYVDDEKVDTFAIVDGKAIVTVDFKDVVVEVR